MDLFGGLPDPVKGGRGGSRGGRVPQAKGRGRGGNLDGRGRGGNLDGRGRGRGGNLYGRGRGQPAAKKAAPMVPASLVRKAAPTTTKAAAPSGQWTSTTETKQSRDENLAKKLTEVGDDPVGYAMNASTPSHVEERVDDPYDPAAPNDYVEIQKRKELLRTVERRERQRQQHLERLEREQERLAEERRDLAKKAMEGDAAALASAGRGMGRGRGGVSNLPAWMKAAATEAAAEKPPPAPATATRKKSKPTKVLQLRNLGDGEEDFEQLREEIASECQKYGTVDASHAVDALEGEAAVYIRFTERRAAAKALVDLEGRFFAGQKIAAAFFDESKFESREFG